MTHASLYIARSYKEVTKIPDSARIENADVTHVIRDSLGIDDVRLIRGSVYTRPILGPYKSFIIQCASITQDAQNALLKILEEPPDTCLFYVVVPFEDVLLPTLRSRLQLIREENTSRTSKRDLLTTFLNASYGERIEMVQDRQKKKDVAWFEALLRQVEEYAASLETSPQRVTLLKTIVFLREYAPRSGSSKKMLFEELSFSLPEAGL